jgi:hypothetical protein
VTCRLRVCFSGTKGNFYQTGDYTGRGAGYRGKNKYPAAIPENLEGRVQRSELHVPQDPGGNDKDNQPDAE